MRCQKCSTVMKEDEVICPKCGFVHEQELPSFDLKKLTDTTTEVKKYKVLEGQPRTYYQEKGKRGFFAIIELYKKAFDFSGVADWAEYWTQYLFISIFAVANILTRDVILIPGLDFTPLRFATFYISLIVIIFSAIPMISATVRRLHDAGYSGYFYLITFIPVIGSFGLFVLTLAPYNRNEHNDFYEKYSLGQ